MINLRCEECSFINNLVFRRELANKKVKFQCKNPECKQYIIYTFPNQVEVSTDQETVISGYASDTLLDAGLIWNEGKEDSEMTFPIKDGVNLIGRKSSLKTPTISIPSDDKTMSRMHCVIIKTKENLSFSYLLKEYDNKNNLILNGKKLAPGTEVYLQDRDIIHLGRTPLRFSKLH